MTGETRPEPGKAAGRAAEVGSGAGQAADEDRAAGVRRSRRPRRASLPAPEGSDPEPYDPPLERRSEGENDARLLGDRPPHWG